MGQRITTVDAFTPTPFAGNPAAVCILDRERDAHWMQSVAREMNLAETSFLRRANGHFDLRWFTPTVEVDLCGHATLAAAHVLWSEGHLSPADQAVFQTRSGRLTADKRGEWIELDFPAVKERRADAPAGLAEALGAAPLYVGKNTFDYLVELESEEVLRSLRPEMSRLETISCRGVIVTARAETSPYDFISRFFAPQSGIPEDPVTGSAHCCLGPFWRERLKKDDLLAYQASQRGGVVRVGVRDDRVLLGGQAVTVMTADLLV